MAAAVKHYQKCEQFFESIGHLYMDASMDDYYLYPEVQKPVSLIKIELLLSLQLKPCACFNCEPVKLICL